VRFTDEEKYFVSEASVYRLLKAHDLIRKRWRKSSQPAHGHTTIRFWATTAKELSLPVRTDMPNEVLELMSLYPQPVRTQDGGGIE
jgi:hypothetical protein